MGYPRDYFRHKKFSGRGYGPENLIFGGEGKVEGVERVERVL